MPVVTSSQPLTKPKFMSSWLPLQAGLSVCTLIFAFTWMFRKQGDTVHQTAVISLFGLIVSVLVAFIVHLYQKAASEARKSLAVKNALESEILEHQKTGEELKVILSRLDMAARAGGIGVWTWDVETGLLAWNERMYSLYDVPPDVSPTYETWRSTLHEDDLEETESLLSRAVQGQGVFNTEFRIITTSGEIRHMGAAARVERDHEGRPKRVTGMNWDITNVKQAVETLRKSEAQTRLLLNSTAEGIYGIDLDGNCTFANPSCLRILGYRDMDELLGRNMHELIHHSFQDGRHMPVENCKIYQAFRVGDKVHADDEVLWRADGSSFPAEYWSYPQVVNGEVTGAVVTFNDISERQFAQEQLALKQEQLEALNQSLQKRVEETVSELRKMDQILILQGRQAAMGEMIGNIAHQWRQPLNALAMLIANIQMAQRNNELNEEYLGKSAVTANRLIQKMSTTINDFRNFFNPDKEMVPFSALQQIRSAVDLVEAAYKNSNIYITVEQEQDFILNGFPNEYSQVLLNLLNNAKDAIVACPSTAGQISIRLEERDGMGRVTVQDNGGGIPGDIIDRIFEPYFSTKSMGTGIGLYMSKMIIERNMHGSITARTITGGSEFTVQVPRAEGMI